MENENIKKGKKYLLIGVLVLFLAILGSSVAYYLARVQGSLSGNAAGTELTLDITPLSTSATDDLIPLDNDKDTLTMAALGYGNNTNEFDNTKSCIDINGYSVCQVYKITLTNKGSAPVTVNGGVELSGANTPNIDCAKMASSTSVTDNASCKGSNTLANNETINGNSSEDYYVLVYINNLDEPQYDKGEFNGTVTFTSTQGIAVKGRFKPGVTLVEHITNLYTSSAKTVVINNDVDYNYATSVNLMNDRLGGTTQSLDGGNIRYYGANPNNYIDIGDKYEVSVYEGNWNTAMPPIWNTTEECLAGVQSNGWTDEFISRISSYSTINEFCSINETPVEAAGTPILWRIIGIFDGKVRIIRNESIGKYSWDTSANNVNTGYGINQWGPSGDYKGADLMKLLNPGYESEQTGGSLYWNSGNGTCYNGAYNATTECDFTNTGLSEEAKEYVVDQTLYLGGFDTSELFANQAYLKERGNNVFDSTKECYGNSVCNDNITRTLTWTGKVGLIYPSDYGYATDLTYCKYNLRSYDDTTCKGNNWLNRNNGQYVVTPDSVTANNFWYLESTSNIRSGSISVHTYDVYPVITLSADTYIIDGIGTKDNPYIITN